MAPKKKAHINFFDMACASSHMGVGQWKDPEDNTRSKDSIEYYTWLAKLAEKARDKYQGKHDAAFQGGSTVANLDPVVFVSAMAAVTKSVSFGITGSTSYLNPYVLARTWSTLDHATKGRVAWNIVTSYSTPAAQAMGKHSVTPHDQRYAEAHEYMDLMYSLWEGSWEDGAQIWDPERGAYDPSKIHKIDFRGAYHNTRANNAAHPSRQRTPVLFQAGSSEAGKIFAAKHAEAIFCGGTIPSDLAPFVKAVRDQAAQNGRDPQSVKFFPMFTPFIGKSVQEAQAKYAKAKSLAHTEGGLAKLSSYLGVDLSKFPLDEPFELSGNDTDAAIQSMLTVVERNHTGEPWTPRQLGHQMAFQGFGPMPVGTPEMVADVMEQWINEADIDGFNVAYVSNPQSYDDVVDLLIPVLIERGIMREDYAAPGGTFRENLYGKPGEPLLPDTHAGAQFRYDVLKEKYALPNGDILIDRRKEKEEAEKAAGEKAAGEKPAGETDITSAEEAVGKECVAELTGDHPSNAVDETAGTKTVLDGERIAVDGGNSSDRIKKVPAPVSVEEVNSESENT